MLPEDRLKPQPELKRATVILAANTKADGALRQSPGSGGGRETGEVKGR